MNEWIYVEQMLPTPSRLGINSGEMFCNVIVYSNWGGIQVGMYYEKSGFKCPTFDMNMNCDEKLLDQFYEHITHWMPTPPPPPQINKDGQMPLTLET